MSTFIAGVVVTFVGTVALVRYLMRKKPDLWKRIAETLAA